MAFTHPYLKDKNIKVKPAPSRGAWAKFVSNEQAASLTNAAAFHPDTVRTYVVPPRSFFSFTDDTTPKECPDFGGEMLTERKYFEKKLGLNLDPFNPDNSMVKEYNPKTGRLEVTYVTVEDELSLDLKNPIDMIKYKVLLQYPAEIARSKEVYKTEKRLGLLYVMVDDSPVDDEKVDAVDARVKAYLRYSEVTSDKETCLKFLNAAGKVYDPKTDFSLIKAKVIEFLEADPQNFLNLANDPDTDLKWVLSLARKKDLLDYDTNSKLYKTKSGTALKFDELVSYYKNSKHSKELNDLRDAVI
jgi:hypothetical protein